MVQHGAQKGTEMDFSTNRSKCKGGRSATVGPSVGNGKKPLVAVSGRYSDNREGPMSSMGVPTSNITDTYPMRGEPKGVPVRAEDAVKCADIHLSLREQTHCETNSIFPTDSCV